MFEYLATWVASGIFVLGFGALFPSLALQTVVIWLFLMILFSFVYYGGIFWVKAVAEKERDPNGRLHAVPQFKLALSLLTITLVIVLIFSAVIWIH